MKTTVPTDQEHRPRSQGKEGRHPRFNPFLQSLAAVLIIAALLGSFIALLGHRHSSAPGLAQQGPSGEKHPLVAVASSDGTVYALQPSTGALLWHYATHQRVVAMLQQDGVVYISAEGTLDQSAFSELAFIYKLRASDGSLLWKNATSGIGPFIAVDDGIIITSEGRPAGLIKAFNAENGSLLWQHPTETGTGRGWGNAMITEHDHILYLRYLAHGSSGGAPEAIVAIKAFDIRSGKLLWLSSELPHVDIKTSVSTATSMYVLASDTHTYDLVIFTLDLKNGKLMKRLDLPPGESLPDLPYPERPHIDSFDAGILYVNKLILKQETIVLNSYVCAIRITDGTSLWCSPTFPSNISSVASSNHMFYYQHGGKFNDMVQVVALNASDGKFRWRWTVPGNSSPPANSKYMAAYNGIVYVTSLHGIFALSGNDGHVLWHVLTNVNLSTADSSVPDHI